MRAAFSGDLAQVMALLDEGSDVNARDRDGDTALMFASFNGHFLIVKALLGHGADVHARARNGWTALQAAKSKFHHKIARLLEQAEEQSLAEGMKRLVAEFEKHDE